MGQVHTRFTSEQVRFLLETYLRGTMSRKEVQEALRVGKTRFFALAKEYRRDPQGFSVSYERGSPGRLGAATKAKIKQELLREKKLVDDPRIPIRNYNYSAVRDRLKKHGVSVSVPTIIRRAKNLDCHIPHRRRAEPHTREVVTTSVGALIQHDASLRLWSPYAREKWTLITSIDDYSRNLLYAAFFPIETTWNHIRAAQSLMESCGIPLRYCVDSQRIFRFVQGRDSLRRKHVLQTDEADPQWKQVMQLLGVEVIHARSPQAKGKVERLCGWMQDRIVRTCALEGIDSIADGRAVLHEELDRYPGLPIQGRQQPSSPPRHRRDSQPSLRKCRPGRQQPLPTVCPTQALHLRQRNLLPERAPHGQRLPPHIPLRS